MTDEVDKKKKFSDKVEFYCRELCEEIGVDPDGNDSPHCGWTAYYDMVHDWLLTEAFAKIKQRYWVTEI
jgi:hypothetical protein